MLGCRRRILNSMQCSIGGCTWNKTHRGLLPAATAAATEPEWKQWRRAMNAAVKDRYAAGYAGQRATFACMPETPAFTPQTMRYEPQPNKNVLGYWTNAADWADWEFEVADARHIRSRSPARLRQGERRSRSRGRGRRSDAGIHGRGHRPFSEHDPADDRASGARRRNTQLAVSRGRNRVPP